MRISRIKIAKPDIVKSFENLSTKIFRRNDLNKILEENRDFWRLSLSMTLEEFIKFLTEETSLQKVEINFPRKMIRYTWGQQSLYSVLLTLNPGCYFSHYSAVYFHNLTEQLPKTIYLNVELGKLPRPSAELTQEGIDRAFKAPQRKTKNIARFQNYTIYSLFSKNLELFGVVDFKGPDGENLRVTDVERTLIDIVVRPSYAGGVNEIIKAYQKAKEDDKISANRLIAMLKKFDYIYPYHQAIGFYLERSGVYEDVFIDALKKIEMKFDFYLTHQMKEMDYSKTWRLYYPKGF